MSRPALFLDRDGVINVDHGYVHGQEDFEFMEGIFDLSRTARKYDYCIVVVTNQAGIGRGMYTEDDFCKLTDWMCSRFVQEGAAIDRVYFCPTHPENGVGAYRVESPRRKPAPGMILQAQQELDLDLARSVLQGDKETDILAGAAAGVGCNLLLAPHHLPGKSTQASAIVHSLGHAADYLVKVGDARGSVPSD